MDLAEFGVIRQVFKKERGTEFSRKIHRDRPKESPLIILRHSHPVFGS